jgi:membrane protease YdiL (CAAX protease family)
MEKRTYSSALASLFVLLWAGFFIVIQYVSSYYVLPYLTASWQQFLWSGVVELAFVCLPLALLHPKTGHRLQDGLGRPPRGQGRAIGLAALLAVCAYPVTLLLQNLWILALEAMGAVPSSITLPSMENPSTLLIALIAVAGCAAFAEELALRGILLPALRGRMNNGAAIAVSALIFSLMHGNFTALPYTFLLGFLMGYLALRSQSIFPSMVFHFTNNALAVVLSYWAAGVSDQAVAQASSPRAMLLSLLSLATVALPAAVMLAVLLTAYRKVTPGAAAFPREKGGRFWWVPMVLGTGLFAYLVAVSGWLVFHGGAACIWIYSA